MPAFQLRPNTHCLPPIASGAAWLPVPLMSALPAYAEDTLVAASKIGRPRKAGAVAFEDSIGMRNVAQADFQ
jgi:hypothetical protein